MYKYCLIILFHIYAFWCRVFNFLETVYYSNVPFLTYDGKGHPLGAFSIFTRGLFYRKDSWYMLWDVISTPSAILHRGGDDCDGFARLAVAFFGDSFSYRGNKYTFDGLCALVFNKAPHHMVALYRSSDGSYVSIGQSFFFYRDFDSFLSFFNDKYLAGHHITYIGRFVLDKKDRIRFKGVQEVTCLNS